jgi:hypothetical protein
MRPVPAVFIISTRGTTVTTLPATLLESIDPQRQRLRVSLSTVPDPVICRYQARETRELDHQGTTVTQCFATVEPVVPEDLGGEELTLTWTVGKPPATLVGCLWVWDREVEAYRWDSVRVTGIAVDTEPQREPTSESE